MLKIVIGPTKTDQVPGNESDIYFLIGHCWGSRLKQHTCNKALEEASPSRAWHTLTSSHNDLYCNTVIAAAITKQPENNWYLPIWLIDNWYQWQIKRDPEEREVLSAEHFLIVFGCFQISRPL